MTEKKPTITHGRNAWRDPGKPRKYVTDRRCRAKVRYTDEPQAMAAALVRLEELGCTTDRLWTYRCKHCSGWHITSSPCGREHLVVRAPQRRAA